MEPFTFEKQVVEHLGGISNDIQRGDKGIDGRILSDPKKVISIKRSDKIGRNVVDNFASAMRREKVTEGIIVAFTFGKGAPFLSITVEGSRSIYYRKKESL
jgi:hypothetical protein